MHTNSKHGSEHRPRNTLPETAQNRQLLQSYVLLTVLKRYGTAKFLIGKKRDTIGHRHDDLVGGPPRSPGSEKRGLFISLADGPE